MISVRVWDKKGGQRVKANLKVYNLKNRRLFKRALVLSPVSFDDAGAQSPPFVRLQNSSEERDKLKKKLCEKLDLSKYDVHIDCANKCGTKLHIKPKQKLGVESNRIPRGYVCSNCKDKIENITEITEAGES